MSERVSIDGGLRSFYELGRSGHGFVERDASSPYDTSRGQKVPELGSNEKATGQREPKSRPEGIDHPWWESHSESIEERGQIETAHDEAVEKMAIKYLRELSGDSGEGLEMNEVPVSLSGVCIDHFGSWNATLEKVGLGLFGTSGEQGTTKSQVLKWVKREAQESGKIPLPDQAPITREWVQQHFGSWSEMLGEAGAWRVVLEKLPVVVNHPGPFTSKIAELYSFTNTIHNRPEVAALAASVVIACLEKGVPVTRGEVRDLVWESPRRVSPPRAWNVHAVMDRLEKERGLDLPSRTVSDFIKRGIRKLTLSSAIEIKARGLSEKLDERVSTPEKTKYALAAGAIYISGLLARSKRRPRLATVATAYGVPLEPVRKSGNWIMKELKLEPDRIGKR